MTEADVAVQGMARFGEALAGAAQAMDRASRRVVVSVAAARMLRAPDVRASLGVSTTATVIPVLADDPVSYLLDRWAEATGPVVVAFLTDDGLRLVVMGG